MPYTSTLLHPVFRESVGLPPYTFGYAFRRFFYTFLNQKALIFRTFYTSTLFPGMGWVGHFVLCFARPLHAAAQPRPRSYPVARIEKPASLD